MNSKSSFSVAVPEFIKLTVAVAEAAVAILKSITTSVKSQSLPSLIFSNNVEDI